MKNAWFVAVLMLAAQPALAASFSCQKAVTVDEHAICDDPRLSQLDDLLPAAYRAAKTVAATDVPQVARDFLADRRSCGADTSCIMSTYLAVLGAYRDLGAKIAVPTISATALSGNPEHLQAAIPTKLGQCSSTAVVNVAPRLQSGDAIAPADFDSGTSVTFENNGFQVSYERENALLNSKRSDRVVMCLISIPHHCPPNDDRGRIYVVTNLRTQQTWTLPDSQHSCGGA